MKQFKKNGKYSITFIKFMQEHYRRYNKSTYTDLYQVYTKPSIFKLRALEYIKRYKAQTTPYITSHNTNYFTVAYFTTEEELEYFCVDTGKNTYVILSMYL